MSQYMLLVYEEDAEDDVQAEREGHAAEFVQLHRELREAGVLIGVKALRKVESATSVRLRDGKPEITDGPFATTKEQLVGFYLIECADLDEALRHAGRVPVTGWGTVEVRPTVPAEEWYGPARRLGVDVTAADVADMAW